MSKRKIVSIVFIIIGLALFYFSHYIHTEVAEGRGKIASAQKKVDTTNTLFSLNPEAQKIGDQLTKPVQKKIDEGSQEANQYEQYATWSMIGGIICIILGISGFFMRKKRS